MPDASHDCGYGMIISMAKEGNQGKNQSILEFAPTSARVLHLGIAAGRSRARQENRDCRVSTMAQCAFPPSRRGPIEADGTLR